MSLQIRPNAANVAQGWQLLEDGLTLLGIGAKTAVGYGVMEKARAAKRSS